ncbi:hypothetical protein B0T26DRAFT_706269 [Lasiosphaeria miniovina]|uniref:Uncharacterized protein n=1 Tax=Lasiosphaeria miniovina TaxID=1954250 RepID=A0AA40E452_9PEZI|nr:uncharacterized protein B0T26DRAFT_706269 [Lasiosphaeria miniovina]KAK0723366.1 hypothetical protein B0T26DRAFT_706269 [Lasiosphaeria miniovina]
MQETKIKKERKRAGWLVCLPATTAGFDACFEHGRSGSSYSHVRTAVAGIRSRLPDFPEAGRSLGPLKPAAPPPKFPSPTLGRPRLGGPKGGCAAWTRRAPRFQWRLVVQSGTGQVIGPGSVPGGERGNPAYKVLSMHPSTINYVFRSHVGYPSQSPQPTKHETHERVQRARPASIDSKLKERWPRRLHLPQEGVLCRLAHSPTRRSQPQLAIVGWRGNGGGSGRSKGKQTGLGGGAKAGREQRG